MGTQVSELILHNCHDFQTFFLEIFLPCSLMFPDLIVGAFGADKAILYRYVVSNQLT